MTTSKLPTQKFRVSCPADPHETAIGFVYRARNANEARLRYLTDYYSAHYVEKGGEQVLHSNFKGDLEADLRVEEL